MKTMILLACGATVLYLVAKRYNINSLEDLKNFISPLEELKPKFKALVPQKLKEMMVLG